jgi:hypothetical protein
MPRQPAPENETKRQCFERVGVPRVRKAVKAISVIGNLNGPQYEYTIQDVGHIVDALNKAVEDMETRLGGDGPKGEEGFTFKPAKAKK